MHDDDRGEWAASSRLSKNIRNVVAVEGMHRRLTGAARKRRNGKKNDRGTEKIVLHGRNLIGHARPRQPCALS